MLRRFLPALTLVVAALGAATPAQAAGQAMPAADGEPMLWPIAQTVSDVGERLVGGARYGFVDTDGELVVAATYRSYSYCADGDGRPSAVLAGGNGGSDLIDLTGAVVGHVAAARAECAGTGYLIVTEPAEGRWEVSVVEVATGAQLLAPSADQKVAAVMSGVVNVSGSQREYFLDLATGVITPHPGRVTVPALESGAPGVPAAARATSGASEGRLGYLGRNGKWLVRPVFDAASAFRGGYAVVEQNGRATFLDAGLRRVGGQWEQIRPITVPAAIGERVVGYWVEDNGRRGLLGPDLQVVVQPGPGQISCEPGAGVCAVVAPDGSADLVRLPQGGAVTLPAGFTRVLTDGLVADRPATDRTGDLRIQSLTTGRTLTLPAAASCRGVGELFVTCSGGLVIDADGDLTGYTSAVAIPDPAGGPAYYWVTADHEQGFLDTEGRWRYRERR